ncbi:hypothetical protein THRCLA_09082 [Thraustotheca clavata]|uniref:Uncharacterized protein n=1 Tax=Thraustotheca clavata TaxID=74557 RepID=A0A1V9YZQ2_9STRA|nr:hypothetical protein THRCLA_09082 [Thraustotheca clavata]
MKILNDHVNYAEQNIDTSQLPLIIACVNYVNSGVNLLALVVIIYIIYTHGHVEGLKLFTLYGIGGIVWLGRPMLFIRSMTALGVLSTSTLTLVQEKNLVHFASMDITRPCCRIIKANHNTSLDTSVVLWLALIANDIAMVRTHIYTTNYGFLHRS